MQLSFISLLITSKMILDGGPSIVMPSKGNVSVTRNLTLKTSSIRLLTIVCLSFCSDRFIGSQAIRFTWPSLCDPWPLTQPVSSNPVSTSSFCQQPRLHCSRDKNQVWRPSLLCCWSDSMEVCLSLSDQPRLLLVLSASWKPICSTFHFN